MSAHREKARWHRHRWESVAQTTYRGEPCIRWQCEVCGQQREIFADLGPPRGSYGGTRKPRKDNGRENRST